MIITIKEVNSKSGIVNYNKKTNIYVKKFYNSFVCQNVPNIITRSAFHNWQPMNFQITQQLYGSIKTEDGINEWQYKTIKKKCF